MDNKIIYNFDIIEVEHEYKSVINILEEDVNVEEIKLNLDFSFQKIQEFQKDFEKLLANFNNLCIAVIGSFGRMEASMNSDIDYIIIYKDSSNLKENLKGIRAKIDNYFKQKEFKKRSCFNIISFDDLLKNIGGEEDTNKNLTTRILLLLESIPIFNLNLYNKIINGLFSIYLEEFLQNPEKHPQFILNELMRYWRTLCIDYRYKRTEINKPFPIRVLKLRISRKLKIFSAFMVILNTIQNSKSHEYLTSNFGKPSIIQMSNSFEDMDIEKRYFIALSDCLNQFLHEINDEKIRDKLDKIDFDTREESELYVSMRKMGQKVQDNIRNVFKTNNILGKVLDSVL